MNRRIIFASTILLVFLAALVGPRFAASDVPPSQPLAPPSEAAPALIDGSVEKFNYLAEQSSSYCSLQPTAVDTYPEQARLQGACCSPMDLHRYQEQVEGLKELAAFRQIPADPYDIPAALAKELLTYQREIVLTGEQEAVYDEAMALSDEGGPCCCKCWRWHAFEGQAKYLISEQQFTAAQVAEVWDLEDGCGGAGHAGGGHHTG